jgi:hypothetical protein
MHVNFSAFWNSLQYIAESFIGRLRRTKIETKTGRLRLGARIYACGVDVFWVLPGIARPELVSSRRRCCWPNADMIFGLQ